MGGELDAENLLEKVANPRTINGWLDEWMSFLANIIAPHVVETGQTHYALDLGEGWQGYPNWQPQNAF